jgi:hypothetical protein
MPAPQTVPVGVATAVDPAPQNADGSRHPVLPVMSS